ncbi:MAG TPA: hypothetical protein VL854_04375, partial [Nitrososphaeraceae archaeon]|nr:hypothetical protein [Nitrososphaeraceae archaeon]
MVLTWGIPHYNIDVESSIVVKSFIVGLPLSYMTKYLIKGKIKDDNGAPIADLHLQAMDSDQQL